MTRRFQDVAPGFSLIEALVALTLIGVTLLLAMALLAQEPGLARRLSAQEEALMVLNAAQESIRAGRRIPAEAAPFPWQDLFEPGFALAAAEDIEVWTDRLPSDVRGLDRLVLTLRWRAGGRAYERTVHTLWRRR